MHDKTESLLCMTLLFLLFYYYFIFFYYDMDPCGLMQINWLIIIWQLQEGNTPLFQVVEW